MLTNNSSIRSILFYLSIYRDGLYSIDPYILYSFILLFVSYYILLDLSDATDENHNSNSNLHNILYAA